jgi:hypothetical protein
VAPALGRDRLGLAVRLTDSGVLEDVEAGYFELPLVVRVEEVDLAGCVRDGLQR